MWSLQILYHFSMGFMVICSLVICVPVSTSDFKLLFIGILRLYLPGYFSIVLSLTDQRTVLCLWLSFLKLFRLWTKNTFTRSHQIPAPWDIRLWNSFPKCFNYHLFIKYPRGFTGSVMGAANFIFVIFPPCLFSKEQKFNG